MSVYYGGLHTPVPLVVTPHGPPLSPVRVHGHARLSRVNSSPFSGYLVTPVRHPPYSCPPRWKLTARHHMSAPIIPESRRGRHPLAWKSNRESGGNSRCKSFRELTSTVHENYVREAARRHERNNPERSWCVRNFAQEFSIFHDTPAQQFKCITKSRRVIN